MTIWIDADSCPKMVRDFTVKIAAQLSITINFVANKKISAAGGSFNMIICQQTKDAADNYIVENSEDSDLVVTRDILLAKRLVEKGICTLNDRGTVFTNENINEKVSIRNFDLDMALLGFTGTKSNTYGKKEFSQFANCFDKEIHKLIRISKTETKSIQ